MRWTLACTIGLIPAALGMPLIFSAGELPPLVRILALALLGAVEGLTLGWAQAIVLHHDGIIKRRDLWVAATTAGSCVAWAIVGVTTARQTGVLPAEMTPVALVFCGGHGVLVGLAQWAVLRRDLPDASPWAAACGLAWMAGERLTYAGLVAVAAGAAASTLALTRLIMGLMIGAITGLGLVILTEEKENPKERRL